MTDRPGANDPTDRSDQGDRTRCTICNHDEREPINAALRGREQSGESWAKIAGRFKVNESSLKRHARNHGTDPPSSKGTRQTTVPTDPPIDDASDAKAPPTEPSAKSNQPPLQTDPPPEQAPVVAVVVADEPGPTGGSTTTTNGSEENKNDVSAEEQARAILLVQAKPRPGPLCKVCSHDERTAIENAMAEGVPYTRIERMFPGTSDTGIRRHRDECVGRAILAARLEMLERANLTTAEAFRGRLEALVVDAENLVTTAKSLLTTKAGGDGDGEGGLTAENVKAVGAAIKTAEGVIVSLGKLLGLFPTGTTINVINHPHFSTTVNKIVDTICEECLAPVRKVLSEAA
jgi:hypothetical protein